MTICSRDHRNRLFVGEAGFKGIEALLDKHKTSHPNLSTSIVATELNTFERSSEVCQKCDELAEKKRIQFEACAALANLYLKDGMEPIKFSDQTFFCSDRCKRIKKLQDQGVTVILGFDATKIHKSEHSSIKGKKFSRIHWNCPHNRSNFFAQTLPKLISDFFASSFLMQNSGHRIHITLSQPPGMENFYQGVIYNIRTAASTNNYCLYAKRFFGSQRYPGYEHEVTGFDQAAEAATVQREFVFVKQPYVLPEGRFPSGYTVGLFSNPHRGYSFTREYYTRDTDNESSDYSTENEES